MNIPGRIISKGIAYGKMLISKEPISFLGMVDPKKGVIIDNKHDLYGCNIKDKILLFPYGSGSTVGSYIIYQLKINNVAPSGIINIECDTIIGVGAIMANIPLIDKLKINPYSILKNDDYVVIDGEKKLIKILKS